MAGIVTAPKVPIDVVELHDVSVEFKVNQGMWGNRSSSVLAVDRVTLGIEDGATLGLLGATGSGKSTIAQTILGMVKPTGGFVRVAGNDLARLSGSRLRTHQRRIQFVPQDPYSSLNPRMRIGRIVAEPLQLPAKVVSERVQHLLRMVGLPSGSDSLFPHQFSGGQRQRVAIARALGPDPNVIVLDEPTSALDVSIRAQILNLLKDLQQQLGMTYLYISHDLASVAYITERVAVLYLGRVVELGPTAVTYASPLHPYTWLLHASSPNFGDLGKLERLEKLVAGVAVQKAEVGCAFRSRCALWPLLGRPDRCVDDQPQLREVLPGRSAACHFAEDAERLAG